MWSKRNVNRTCAWIPALSCHVMSCHLICLWLGGCSWSCVLSVILHFSTDGVFRILTRTKRVFLETVVTCLLTVSKKQTSFGPSGTEVRRANRIGLHLYNVVLYKPLTRCRVVELFWVFGQQRTFDVTPSHTRSTYTEEEKKKDRSMTSHQCDAHSWINARRSSAQHVGVTFSGTCALSVPVLTYEYQRFSIECRELHNLFIRNDIKLIKDWREKKKRSR